MLLLHQLSDVNEQNVSVHLDDPGDFSFHTVKAAMATQTKKFFEKLLTVATVVIEQTAWRSTLARYGYGL